MVGESMSEHLSYEIRGRLVIITSRGPFGIHEDGEFTDRMLGDPEFPDHCRVLIDVRDMTEAPSRDEIARRASWMVESVRGRVSMCALVVGGPLAFGLARMLSSFSDALGLEMEVFDDREKAESWLRVRTGG